MQINAKQLHSHLSANLAPIYLVCGDEPLLVDECCATVREAARSHGFDERSVMTVESGFDWETLYASVHTPSLFSPRRLVELRLPKARPGDAGAEMLVSIAQQPAQDTLLLVSTGKLDRRTQASRWVKALERSGVIVRVYSLDARDLPGWITERMRSRGLTPGSGVSELLSYYFEGNLLAAAQEVDKLAMLHEGGTLRADDIQDNLSDNARFSVFTLVDTCLGGDCVSVARILASVRSEGTEAVLILRVLAREARSLAQMAVRLARGEREAHVFEAYNVWPRRRALVRQALKCSDGDWWFTVLSRAAYADRVLKGRAAGEIWQELQCLALALSGQRGATCWNRLV